MRLGVFGGTFDPPHLGHLILAQQALEQLSLDRVLFIPAGDPWRKAERRVTPARHRLEMTRLALAGNDAFLLDDCEVTREGPSYTVDTLRLLHERSATDELFLLLGEDALADMAFWRDPPSIAALAWVAVVARPGVPEPDLPFDPERIVRFEMPACDISSTDLRHRAAHGASLRYQVPDAVIAYIQREGLYRES